jgi:hypothetical protein
VFSEWSLTSGSPAEWRRPRPIMFRESRCGDCSGAPNK